MEEALDKEVGQLRFELGELQQLLHESHERESMVEEEAEIAREEAISLRKELDTLEGHKVESPKVERLREEVKRLEIQLLERSIEQDFVQAKIKLEVHRAVESARRNREEEKTPKLKEEKQWSVESMPVIAPGNHCKQWMSNEPLMSVGSVNSTASVGTISDQTSCK